MLTLTALAPAVGANPSETLGASPTGTYIVVLDSDHPSQVAREHAQAHGADLEHVYSNALNGYAARMSPQAAERIAGDSRVAYVEADQVMRLAHHNCDHSGGPGGLPDDCDDDDDPGGDQVTPWGIERIGADSASATGAGVSAYIIDTGIDPDHADLDVAGGFASENCRGGGCAASWDDDHGHGTHVAGTVAALDNDRGVVGVAPDATLYAVKVMTGSGTGTRSGIIAGIDWVTGHNSGQPRVANMSIGGAGEKTGTCTDSGFVGSDSYHEAICEASRDGVVFAVAAGNDGADASDSAPAAYDDTVITVSATSEGDDWPYWSNWGTGAASWTSNDTAPVAIAAPGVEVLSTQAGGGTTTMSGTSMASPHVAGAVALHLESANYSGDLSAFDQTRSALLGAAESTSTWSNTSGNPHDEGFLDVR